MLVLASPGAGKSRLGHELVALLGARLPTPLVLVGRGSSHLRDLPMGVIAGALSQLFGLHEQEGLDVARHRVRARVGRNVPRAERDRIAGFLGELLGVPFPDETHATLAAARLDNVKMGDLIRAAWEELLAAELSAGPVVLMVDDIQFFSDKEKFWTADVKFGNVPTLYTLVGDALAYICVLFSVTGILYAAVFKVKNVITKRNFRKKQKVVIA